MGPQELIQNCLLGKHSFDEFLKNTLTLSLTTQTIFKTSVSLLLSKNTDCIRIVETISKHRSHLYDLSICVPRLCTLDGRPLSGPSELENNQYYIAVGADKFKDLPYDRCRPYRDLIRENNIIKGYDTCDFK